MTLSGYILSSGNTAECTISTDHSSSCYGQPVVLINGEVVSPFGEALYFTSPLPVAGSDEMSERCALTAKLRSTGWPCGGPVQSGELAGDIFAILGGGQAS